MRAYAYTSLIWAPLAAAALQALLATYGWRRRSVPGGLPFAVLMACFVAWALSGLFEVAAVDLETAAFWVKVKAIWQLPAATAVLWFALEYANVGGALTRRAIPLLILPSLVLVFLVFINPAHLGWREYWFDRQVRAALGPGVWIIKGYGIGLLFVSSAVFVWLFVRSPLHRWPAAMCLGGQGFTRVTFLVNGTDANPFAPLDATIIGSVFTASMYALALFKFRMLNVVPVARGTVLAQMRDGVLVMNPEGIVVDLNPAAERLLCATAQQARGRRAVDLLPGGFAGAWTPRTGTPTEISVGQGAAAIRCAVHVSALESRGLPLGNVALLHDVTEERRVQARVLEQERALAVLHERDRVARELHDGIGQVLGYIKMQTHAARTLISRGRVEEADANLARMLAVAQDSHAEVREYILSAGDAESNGGPLLPSLERHLRLFRQHHGIEATLETPPDLPEDVLEPMVSAQLLRIIQESLSNVRKHAGARHVGIHIDLADGHLRASVEDDGAGFNAGVRSDDGPGFGLRFMQERAQQVGGRVQVRSERGAGTRVLVEVPARTAIVTTVHP